MFHSPLLITNSALLALQRSIALAPTIAERIEYEAAANRNGPKIARTEGKIAVIDIDGVLTPEPDVFAKMFGGGNTAYKDIINALLEADANPRVDRVLLRISSPGGTVQGLFETLDVLESMTKPVTTQTTMACSAAYAIAAATSSIEAAGIAAQVGSVGVAVSFFVPNDLVDIANTASPKKRPDVRTDAGKAMVREELDSFFQVFVEAVARGRKTSHADVEKNYGKGAVLIARDALARGMIDRIAPPRSAMPGSDMAVAERMIERMDAVRRGEFSPLAGESQPDFCKRMSAEVLGYETRGQRRTRPQGRSLLDHAADAYCADDATERGIDLFLEQRGRSKDDGRSLLEHAADVYCGDEPDAGDAVCARMFGEDWRNQ